MISALAGKETVMEMDDVEFEKRLHDIYANMCILDTSLQALIQNLNICVSDAFINQVYYPKFTPGFL